MSKGSRLIQLSEDDRPEIQIGILGFTGAGKTTYLTVLLDAMSDIGWDANWLDDETRVRLLTDYSIMLEQGKYPLATDRPEENHYWLHLIKQVQLGKWPPGAWYNLDFNLRIIDVSGGRFGFKEFDPKIITKYISECNGILFLIDPKELWRQYEDTSPAVLMTNIFMEMDRYRRRDQKIFIAFCVTKMDLYPDREYWDNIEEFARKSIFKNHPNTLQVIDHFCQPQKNVVYRWFPCSSVGFMANGKSRHDRDEQGVYIIKDSKNVKPVGVGDPLDWLLKEIWKIDLRFEHKGRTKFLNPLVKLYRSLLIKSF